MKKNTKYIFICLSCCLIASIFLFTPFNKKQKVYASIDLNIETNLTKIEWEEIKEKDYIQAISQKYHIPFSKAKQMNFESNMKLIPEAFDKNADDAYAPKILYRVIRIKQDTDLNAQIIGTIHVKMLSKGTYFNASRYKKFIEVINSFTEVKGKFSPIWIEKWLDTRIEESNNPEQNSLWVSIAGTLKYDIDAKIAAELNLPPIFEVDAESSTRFQFSEPIGFVRELHSNDY